MTLFKKKKNKKGLEIRNFLLEFYWWKVESGAHQLMSPNNNLEIRFLDTHDQIMAAHCFIFDFLRLDSVVGKMFHTTCYHI